MRRHLFDDFRHFVGDDYIAVLVPADMPANDVDELEVDSLDEFKAAWFESIWPPFAGDRDAPLERGLDQAGMMISWSTCARARRCASVVRLWWPRWPGD